MTPEMPPSSIEDNKYRNINGVQLYSVYVNGERMPYVIDALDSVKIEYSVKLEYDDNNKPWRVVSHKFVSQDYETLEECVEFCKNTVWSS